VQAGQAVALVALLAVPTSQALQEAAFVVLLYEPAEQAVHVRSEVGVSAISTCCPGWQFVSAVHTLLLVAVPIVDKNWLAVHCVCGVHIIEVFGADVKLAASQAAQIGCVVASPAVITR
jgi:hypothetical protein